MAATQPEALRRILKFEPFRHQEFLLGELPARQGFMPWGTKAGKTSSMVMRVAAALWRTREKTFRWIAPTYGLSDIGEKRVLRALPNGFYKHWKADRVIEHKNGSTLQFMSGENPDLLAGEDCDGAVIDEAPRCKEDVYHQVLSTLISTNGWLAAIGCVAPGTLIATSEGLVPIDALRPLGAGLKKLAPLEPLSVAGLDGETPATHFWTNGKTRTVRVKLRTGLELVCTPNHPLMLCDEGVADWVSAGELKEGDRVAVARGHGMFGKFSIGVDRAWLLGVILGDGSIDLPDYRVIITNNDLRQPLEKLGWKRFRGDRSWRYRLNSKVFIQWLDELGWDFVKGPKKSIPNSLMGLCREEAAALLRGLYDADGFADSKRWRVGLTSTSERMIERVQQLLLAFGIVARRNWVDVEPTALVKASSRVCHLVATGENARTFMQEIGFSIPRKMKAFDGHKLPMSARVDASDVVPGGMVLVNAIKQKSSKTNKELRDAGFRVDYVTHESNRDRDIGRTLAREFLHAYRDAKDSEEWQRLDGHLTRNWFYDEVAAVDAGPTVETMDLHVPEGNAYVTNGIVTHNTPKGRNWFYQKVRAAQQGEDRGGGLVVNEKLGSWFRHFPSFINPGVLRSNLENFRDVTTEIVFKQLVLAEFVDDSAGVFPDLTPSTRTWERREGPDPNDIYVMGVDVGAKNDFTVITIWSVDKLKLEYWERFTWVDTVVIEDRVAELFETWNNPTVYIDRGGMGLPICNNIARRGVDIGRGTDGQPGVHFTSQNKPSMVHNWNLALERGEPILPPKDEWPELHDEHNDFEYTVTKVGKWTFSAAEGKHDDIVTSCILAWFGMTHQRFVGSVWTI